MAETTAYKCPQCSAPLKLDPASGQLTCEFCNGSFDPAVIEAAIEEKSVQRERANKEAQEHQNLAQKTRDRRFSDVPEDMRATSIEEWDRIIAENSFEHFDEMVGYICTNCGAQVVTDKLTVATSCQYCGSSVVVDQRLSGGLKPEYVIPFNIKAQDVARKLTEFYAKRPLLPKDFFVKNQVGEVQGLYVPFWLYDGVIHGDAKYHSSTSVCYTEGKDDVTETTNYLCTRVGDVVFRSVPVDASARIDDDLMDSIRPFDYRRMVPFKAAYLTGFVAERFDQSPRQVFGRAENCMKETAEDRFRSSTVKATNTTMVSGTFELSHAAASYVMMPVYLFNCNYRGTNYRYAVNGQSGKIVGEVPEGPKESFLAFLKPFLIAVGIAAVLVILAIIFKLS